MTQHLGVGRRCSALLLVVLCGVAAVPSRILAAPARPSFTDSDFKALAELSLQWAIDGGIADFTLNKDTEKVIVSANNLPKNITLSIPGHTVVVMSALRVQARADAHGDYLYFEFSPFTHKDGHAEVQLALRWAVAFNSTAQYVSGGGATLEFEKKKGKWRLLPVSHRWMS